MFLLGILLLLPLLCSGSSKGTTPTGATPAGTTDAKGTLFLAGEQYNDDQVARVLSNADPETLKSLHLTASKATEVPDLSRFKNLRTVYIHHNSYLTRLDPGRFAGLGLLQLVDLSFSKLTRLEKGCFADLPKLEIINISDSQLETLEKGCFSGLPGLRELTLHRNPLTRALDALQDLQQLNTLVLDSNPKLPPEDAGGLKRIFGKRVKLDSEVEKRVSEAEKREAEKAPERGPAPASSRHAVIPWGLPVLIGVVAIALLALALKFVH